MVDVTRSATTESALRELESKLHSKLQGEHGESDSPKKQNDQENSEGYLFLSDNMPKLRGLPVSF